MKMNTKRTSAVVIIAASLAVLGSWVALAQDKYRLKIPDGLAFSEFKGYETWQVVSLSHSDETLNVIVANPVMINAYAAGIPGNGKPFPDGARSAKLQCAVGIEAWWGAAGTRMVPPARRPDTISSTTVLRDEAEAGGSETEARAPRRSRYRARRLTTRSAIHMTAAMMTPQPKLPTAERRTMSGTASHPNR
jgi:hypothetical protein